MLICSRFLVSKQTRFAAFCSVALICIQQGSDSSNRAGTRFGFPPSTHSYTLRDLFFVKYEVDGNGAQADLPLHQDGSLVSFNILLNPATEFEGGGTFFEATATTYLIEQGDALFHCGGLRHAAAAITSGRCCSCLCLFFTCLCVISVALLLHLDQPKLSVGLFCLTCRLSIRLSTSQGGECC